MIARGFKAHLWLSGFHSTGSLVKGPASHLRIRHPMKRKNFHIWTVIIENPMAARVALPACLVTREWIISGTVFVESLTSRTVRTARSVVKKTMKRRTYMAGSAEGSLRREQRSSSGSPVWHGWGGGVCGLVGHDVLLVGGVELGSIAGVRWSVEVKLRTVPGRRRRRGRGGGLGLVTGRRPFERFPGSRVS